MPDKMAEEVQRSLGRIEGKLDSVVTTFTTHIKDDAESFYKINAKLNENTTLFDRRFASIDKKIYMAMGALLVISAAFPYLLPTLKILIH